MDFKGEEVELLLRRSSRDLPLKRSLRGIGLVKSDDISRLAYRRYVMSCCIFAIP